MRYNIILLCLFCQIAGYSQQGDDIRVYPSANHQTENSIAIDPTNPDNILVAVIGRPESTKVHIAYFYSNDRGITWHEKWVAFHTGETQLACPIMKTRGDSLAAFSVAIENNLYPLFLRISSDNVAA